MLVFLFMLYNYGFTLFLIQDQILLFHRALIIVQDSEKNQHYASFLVKY